MKRIRQGNDIVVTWSIYKDGKPYALDGVEISLYLSHAFGKTKIESFQTNGNNIVWTFEGKEQKHTGDYSLILVINENEEGMATTDKIDFVRLVPVTPCCEGEDDENIVTEHVDLTSSMEFAPAVIEVGEGGAGLQYAVERTVYQTKMIDLEGSEFEGEITEEQRAYNIETYTKACNDRNVFVTLDGVLLSPFVIMYGPNGYALFNCVMELGGGLTSITIKISASGDAENVIKPIQTGGGGGSIDPALLEGYMPLSRDFSDDFNNDFTR